MFVNSQSVCFAKESWRHLLLFFFCDFFLHYIFSLNFHNILCSDFFNCPFFLLKKLNQPKGIWQLAQRMLRVLLISDPYLTKVCSYYIYKRPTICFIKNCVPSIADFNMYIIMLLLLNINWYVGDSFSSHIYPPFGGKREGMYRRKFKIFELFLAIELYMWGIRLLIYNSNSSS